MSVYLDSLKTQMCCFYHEQGHTTEEDLAVAAVQSAAEASWGHSSSLLPVPHGQSALASSTATLGRFEELNSISSLPASKKKSCCSFPKPVVWLFSVLAGGLKHSNISLFPPAIPSLPPLTWSKFCLQTWPIASSKNNALQNVQLLSAVYSTKIW